MGDAMHLQQIKLKAFQQHLIFLWAKITPLHPSFYFSASKIVFWASLSFPTLSVRYNRWSRNRELYATPHLILEGKKKKMAVKQPSHMVSTISHAVLSLAEARHDW